MSVLLLRKHISLLLDNYLCVILYGISKWDKMSVADRISELYLKNELSDVVFNFPDYGDEKVIGHRIILATASSVFKDLLYSCKPGPEIVNIEGFAPKIFKLVLRYEDLE